MAGTYDAGGGGGGVHESYLPLSVLAVSMCYVERGSDWE